MEWIQRLGLRVEDPQSDGTVTLDECVYINQSFNTSIIDVYLYHANVQLKLKTSFWFCICKRDPIVCMELISRLIPTVSITNQNTPSPCLP